MSRIIQHSEIHHFVDDTNLLHSTNSIKKITNRYINHDLNLIVHRLRAHRISLNVEKTEIIFRPKAKDIKKTTKFQDKWPENTYLKTGEVSRSYAR